MHKTFFKTAVIVIIGLAFAGCEETAKKGDRYMADRPASDAARSTGLFVPAAKEVDLVETMAGFRNSYRESVVDMVDYYKKTGNNTKRLWALSELESLDSTEQYRYLTLGDTSRQDLRATDSIPQANAIYKEAMKLYKDAKWLVVITHGGKLQQALRKFDEIIQKYPTSNKIDDAAYRAGKIYDHFKDYEIAVVYYQRAFQWNSKIRYPVRYRTAYILDKILHKRKEALPIYQESLKKERLDEDKTDFVKLRIKQLTTSKEKSGVKLK
jgi:tetratricopeptide (TPR) repeat protein